MIKLFITQACLYSHEFFWFQELTSVGCPAPALLATVLLSTVLIAILILHGKDN
jgi:hypothetical protein